MSKFISHAKLLAFVFAALLFATSAPAVRAQHEGHDMSGMSKPIPKPKKKPAPKKPAPQKPQPGAQPETQTEEKREAEPAPAQTSPPASTLPDTNQLPPAPAASPASSRPETTDALPASNAAPAGNPSPEVAQPKPAQMPHDHSGMEQMKTDGTENKAQPSGADGSMKEMNMSEQGAGATNGNSLMVMSGEQMDIRVGTRQSNSIAMGQMGSGTSWQPATTPMYMWYKSSGKWLIFFHGDMKLGVNSQGGPRGVTKFESQNWFMPMAFRRVGDGTLQLRGMFSLEPFSFPQGGSPELFQTGETFRGRPIVDAQHPHDLFMEISASYTMPMGERATWFAYLGFPGEPALGPTAFMHRMSASENPSAPLTHHLQDSSHISFGVFTTGFTYRWFKLEGSLFNGREPDENRYNFEFNPWNSRSVRVSVAPNDNWAAQFSYGLLKNPEALEPGDVRRMTASVSYNKRLARGNWASSLIWGRNREQHNEPQTLNGYTAESTVNFLDKNYVYTRLELVDKNSLLSHDEAHDLGLTTDHPVFRIGAYTFGYARDVWNTDKLSFALGSDFTFYSKPNVLDEVYGDSPTSYRFFIRIRPSRMKHSSGGVHTH